MSQWVGRDLNPQCILRHGFTDRLLQPICIPTHVSVPFLYLSLFITIGTMLICTRYGIRTREQSLNHYNIESVAT